MLGAAAGEVGLRCRSGLFEVALRLRLADGRAAAPIVSEEVVAGPLRVSAARLWPTGLAIGRSDLPNRNPLQGLTRWPEEEHRACRSLPCGGALRCAAAAVAHITVWRGEAPDALPRRWPAWRNSWTCR